MHYPPVHNGMDYLSSVVDHLDHEEPGQRALKYAVLHLQAATEVLLKARLVASDWRLAFAEVAEADEGAYKRGDFNSCKMNDAIKRLRNLGVEISPEDKGNITHLGQQRNRLQHFGLTATAPAVEARASQVLDFLIDFVDTYLWPVLDGADARHLDEQMYMVRKGLVRLQGYSRVRMDRLAPELAPRKEYTIRCPDCGKWALLVEGGQAECLFCPRAWDVRELALAYAVGVLGHHWRDYRKTGAPVEPCPECLAESLFGELYLADAPEDPRQFCFSCSQAFDGLEHCMRCTLQFQPDEDQSPICDDCLRGA